MALLEWGLSHGRLAAVDLVRNVAERVRHGVAEPQLMKRKKAGQGECEGTTSAMNES